MEDEFASVQWSREDELDHQLSNDQTPSKASAKSNGKRRSAAGSAASAAPPDPHADAVDNAGIGLSGYLECTVHKPQKENDGSKDAYVSYLISTKSDFKTFARGEFSVRRRFTDFVFLYKTLFREYAHIAIPPLPDKHKMEYVRGDRFSTEFTQRRAHSLDRFMKRISLHPVLRRNPMFLVFLETPDWNATMRYRGTRAGSLSEPGGGGSLDRPVSGGSSAFESFQDWGMNLFTKAHKPDKRFIEVKDRADKLDEDLGHVEKVVARVARRESDLEQDYGDLALQIQKLVTMEPAIGESLTSFAASLETTSENVKSLKDETDQNYLGSLRDMSSYVGALKSLLKLREQKQIDFEALTDYLTKAANDRDILASQHGSSSLSSGASSFIRSKIEDVRGIDHEQSRRDRLRKTEMQIDRLNREVEEAKRTSEAFDDQVVKETAEFERIKSYEFKETLGSLADAQIDFFRKTISTWEEYIKTAENQQPHEAPGGR